MEPGFQLQGEEQGRWTVQEGGGLAGQGKGARPSAVPRGCWGRGEAGRGKVTLSSHAPWAPRGRIPSVGIGLPRDEQEALAFLPRLLYLH